MAEVSRFEDDNRFRPPSPVDHELENELEEALGEMSLEDIIDAEDTAARGGPDELRKGRVIAIHGDDVFVEFGAKSQGVLPASQFEDEPLPKVGDVIEVVIDSYDQRDGLLILSRKGAIRAAAWDTIATGQIVEGRVTDHNKGGLELDINGIRAFMPISQIERFRVENLAPYVNERLRCQVTEVDRAEENVVVSRRDVLEAEAAEAREKIFETLAEGKTVRGVVKTIMPYGAFVDIGGVDGLLHVRDMSHAHVGDPRSVVQEGQQIDVMILKFDRDERKISLGLKQILPSPWLGTKQKWPENMIVEGTVTRITDFGAFVKLTDGVEGLVHISELSDQRVGSVGDVLTQGQTVKAVVLSVDEQAHRMSLSIKKLHVMSRAPVDEALETAPPKPRKRKKPLRGGL